MVLTWATRAAAEQQVTERVGLAVGGNPQAKTARPRLIDEFMPKVEELADRSKGKIRADVTHRKLAAMGYRGSERSTRRAVAEVKQAWQQGRRRRYRPWTEPGMWLRAEDPRDRDGGPLAAGKCR